MSADFIKLITELKNENYSVQVRNVIEQKISCGLFYGFDLPKYENIQQAVTQLKNLGFNLTVFYVATQEQKNFLEQNYRNFPLKIVAVEDLSAQQNKPELVLHFDVFFSPSFRYYFLGFGMDMFHIADAELPEYFYNFYIDNLSELYKVYEMLEDEESKKVFIAFIKGRVTERLKDFRFAPEPQYFFAKCFPEQGDIAIDGGAFDGATARDFSMQGAKVFAFEMSETNYKNCLKLAERYNFAVENFGLSDKKFESFYSDSGAGSSKQNFDTGKVAKFIDLDTYVIEKNLPRVDYIKLDIEGSELQMLHGAARTVSRWKPKMAVSAYHKLDDLFYLPNYVKSIRPDYKIYFRHYLIDCTNYMFNDAQRQILKNLGTNYFVPCSCESVFYFV